MSKLAAFLADWVWFGCLWIMRRPAVHSLQDRTIRRNPRAWESHLKQNRFALQHGRRILRILFTLLIAYLLVLLLYTVLTEVASRGWLTLPDSVRERAGS